MPYFLRRYAHGANRYKAWFLLVFLMPGLYLYSAWQSPDHYIVEQGVTLPPQTRFALPTSPTTFQSVHETVARQADFFQNNFAVTSYFNLSLETIQAMEQNLYRKTITAIRTRLALSHSGNLARITYRGGDSELGQNLVTYYSDRLVAKAKDGIEKSGLIMPRESLPKIAGALSVTPVKTLWKSERLWPSSLLFLSSLICILFFIAGLEWNDSALKSERQIARYVNLPVLGSLPDLNRIQLHTPDNETAPSPAPSIPDITIPSSS